MMARPLVVSLLAFAVVAAFSCQRTGEPSPFSADSAMVHIEKQLSFGPRVPGSAARDEAARYIARSLERRGARVTVQPFEV